MSEGLTAAKLLEVMRSLPAMPPRLSYVLVGHDFLDRAYEVNPADDLKAALGYRPHERLLAVPKKDVYRWYRELQKIGAEVRLIGGTDEAATGD